jgi:hypothetical protein
MLLERLVVHQYVIKNTNTDYLSKGDMVVFIKVTNIVTEPPQVPQSGQRP